MHLVADLSMSQNCSLYDVDTWNFSEKIFCKLVSCRNKKAPNLLIEAGAFFLFTCLRYVCIEYRLRMRLQLGIRVLLLPYQFSFKIVYQKILLVHT